MSAAFHKKLFPQFYPQLTSTHLITANDAHLLSLALSKQLTWISITG